VLVREHDKTDDPSAHKNRLTAPQGNPYVSTFVPPCLTCAEKPARALRDRPSRIPTLVFLTPLDRPIASQAGQNRSQPSEKYHKPVWREPKEHLRGCARVSQSRYRTANWRSQSRAWLSTRNTTNRRLFSSRLSIWVRETGRKCLPGVVGIGQALLMDELVIAVRQARPEDAGNVARVYIESWHDTYPAILPVRLLCAMTPKGQAARWHAAIRARGREQVLVAENEKYGIVGMTSFGPARDRGLGFDGEIYTLYVDPAFFGYGAGRSLLRAAFDALLTRGFSTCVIWAHARNPVRFFYEAMGGQLIAERSARMMGDAVPEAAFGWRKLALAERSAAR